MRHLRGALLTARRARFPGAAHALGGLIRRLTLWRASGRRAGTLRRLWTPRGAGHPTGVRSRPATLGAGPGTLGAGPGTRRRRSSRAARP
ncbi:hypothetical protein, partial [Nocardia rhamnosiphila]|uniref:hypothetical protein n=1 Tax=Nocardia rhamnosiphila TaxID=426716 RepID=UPI001C3F8ED6